MDTEIWAYRDQCEDGQLLRLKEEKMELGKKLSKMKQPAALPGHLGLQAAHLIDRFSERQNLEPTLKIYIF